jgi:hypothetical protein
MLRRTLQRGASSREPDAERVWRYLDRIEGAEQHLLRLVNSLLEMARLERPDLPVEYSEVAVDQLLEDAVEATAPAAAERGLRLERDIPADLPRLWSSELYLQEIVTNLLSNAVKYTPAGGRVTVGASVAAAPRSAAPLDGAPPGRSGGNAAAPLGRRHRLRLERGGAGPVVHPLLPQSTPGGAPGAGDRIGPGLHAPDGGAYRRDDRRAERGGGGQHLHRHPPPPIAL